MELIVAVLVRLAQPTHPHQVYEIYINICNTISRIYKHGSLILTYTLFVHFNISNKYDDHQAPTTEAPYIPPVITQVLTETPAAPVAAVASISPPPLNMFPPQGAPQPGAVSGGGGVTPAQGFSVRNTFKMVMKI